MLLARAGRATRARLDEALGAVGLSVRLLGALGHLAARPDLSYSDLARRAGVTAPSMHATVRRLEELGAVRTGDAGQGRRARLVVTRRGRTLLERGRAAVREVDAELVAAAPRLADPEVLAAFLAAIAPS